MQANIHFFKSALFLIALIPLVRLIWFASNDGLGANPIEFITRSTGTWALVFLCITLAMTPVRMITGSVSWIKCRRMLGLFCFFYACLHFGVWFFLDQGLDLQAMIHDVLKRPFITMGFLSLLLLLPLALTSNQWAIRKLGKRWTLLHQLVYVIACTVIIHYWWHKAGKNDLGTVTIYALIILCLLCLRLPVLRKWFTA